MHYVILQKQFESLILTKTVISTPQNVRKLDFSLLEIGKIKKIKHCFEIHQIELLRLVGIQGDPNQNFPFQMTITLKLSISDPTFANPKCV